MRRFQFVFICLISVIATGFTLTPRRLFAQAGDAAYIFTQINALRQSKGLAPLTINAHLTTSASDHSIYLANHPWTNPHVEADGSTPQSRANAAGYNGIVSENVVGGSTATVQWGWQWWLNSPVHLENMLFAQWVEIGIGVADGPYGRFFTTDFGAGDDPPPTAVVPTVAQSAPNISQISHNASSASSTQKPPPPPTRRPTAVPTNTPTITFTPSNTFTPHPTFTATITDTAAPPTPTAIVLQVSPQPASTRVMNQVLVAVAVTDVPQPILVAQTTPPVQSGSSDVVRGLLPWLIVLQVGVVGGLAVRSLLRRKR